MDARSWRETLERRAIEWGYAASSRADRVRIARRRGLAAVVSLLLVATPLLPAAAGDGADAPVSVIVREVAGTGDAAERAVESRGGTVGQQLSIIGGFAAEVPATALRALSVDPAVMAVTPNAPLQLQGGSWRSERPGLERGEDRGKGGDDGRRGRDRDDEERRGRERDDDHDGRDRPDEDDEEPPRRGRDRHEDGRDDDDSDDGDETRGRGGRDDDSDDDTGHASRGSGSGSGDGSGGSHGSGGDSTDEPTVDEPPTEEPPVEEPGGGEEDGPDTGSILSTARVIGADDYWAAGYTGSGVDVAVIDSGLSPVPGLDAAGKVIRGPDISFESQAPNLRHLDTFGHGTFMAGLIAGHDAGIDPLTAAADAYVGIAPGARIVSIKVADARGATDVSQVIAAIDWVVQHRYDNGLDIRVLNLSFGTYSMQPYIVDPLAYAAEVAWHSGIFVVVAAGNNAPPSGRLMNPAMDPYLMAVGASGTSGTLAAGDDIVIASSARGDGTRNPDLVAPGQSIHGLRVPGSHIDTLFPAARFGDRYFRGTGTSQAAAILSGAAALVIQQRPDITPDQLKALLTGAAEGLPLADARAQGSGLVDLAEALDAPTPGAATQAWLRSTGTGSLEGARGGRHLIVDGVPLQGEQDIFGAPFDATAMAGPTAAGTTWSGGTWNGSVWTGEGWTGNEWSSVQWSGTSWSGNEWSSYEWSANEWSANEWSGSEWSASEWSASEWSASEWSGSEWSGSEWSASEWSTSSWQSAGWPSIR